MGVWARLACLACLAGLVWGLCLFGLQSPDGASVLPPSNRQPQGNQAGLVGKPIEALRPGHKVVTTRPGSAPTQVDRATWRLVKMRAWERWPDGTRDDINIETLQPPGWLAAHGVRAGAWVPLPLDLVEMGLPEDLRGEVLAVEPCPAIQPGPGRVVLTTVNHLNADVRELTVEDGQGWRQTIRPTGSHKFYRASDAQWVSAQALQPGDELEGQNGRVRVVANARVAGVHRVYNLTVEGEHVYRVSSLGALVHNNGCTFQQDVAGPPVDFRHTVSGPRANAQQYVGARTPSSPTKGARPSWQQSEKQLGALFEEAGYKRQPAFKDRKAVNPYTEGSVRPEFYKAGSSVEIKNFDLTTSAGRRSLIQRTTEQALERVTHLPEGTVQKVIIDIRGQTVPVELRRRIVDDLAKKTKGVLKPENITFLID